MTPPTKGRAMDFDPPEAVRPLLDRIETLVTGAMAVSRRLPARYA